MIGLALLICIVFAWFTYHAGLIDLGQWDEAMYLAKARFGPLAAAWGAMYSLALRPLFLFSNDAITVFYAARLLLLFALLPIALFLFCMSFTESLAFAIACSVFIPALNLVVKIDPGIELFNLTTWFFILPLCKNAPANFKSLLIFAAFAGISPFIRQDNILYVFFCFAFIVFSMRKMWRARASLKLLAALITTGATYATGFFTLGGTPFDSDRSLNTFYDFYYWAHPSLFSGAITGNRDKTVDLYFGHADSLSSLVVHHFNQLGPYFASRNLEFFLKLGDALSLPFTLALITVTLMAMLCSKKWPRLLNRRLKILLMMTMIALLKASIICTLLGAFGKYFIEFSLLALLSLAWFVCNLLNAQDRKALTGALLVGVMSYIFANSDLIQKIAHQPFGASVETLTGAPMRSEIMALRELLIQNGCPSEDGVFGITPTANYITLSNHNRTVFQYGGAVEANSSLNFADYLHSVGLHCVIIDDRFRNIAKDAAVKSQIEIFEKDFLIYGYSRFEAVGHKYQVYLLAK